MLSLIAIYLVLVLGIGFLYRSRSIDGYLLAGRRLTKPLLVASIVATFYGATAILGGAELSYYFGLGALWFMVPFYIGNLIVLKFLDKIEKSDAVTLPDFLGGFYNGSVVVASSLLLSVLCLVPASILAMGKIMNLVLPYSAEAWMAVVTLVVVVYTVAGGMRSVAFSDVVQFAFMVGALVLLIPFAISLTPDFLSQIPTENLDPMAYFKMFPQDAIRWSILLVFLPITSAPLYQRFFSSLDRKDIRKAMLYSVVAFFIIDMILLAAGMIAFVNSEKFAITQENADVSIVVLGMGILPGALRGIFVVGLLAAIMSTADSWLHAGASSLAYDVVGRLKKINDSQLILVCRIFVVLLGLGSLLLALYFFDIIEALTALLTIWTSGILVLVMAALSGRRLSSRAALSSLILGAGGAVFWILVPLAEIDPLFIGLGCSVIGALLRR